jgi:hypothetical protein
MKLKRFIAFLLFISLLGFVACSNDDDDGPTEAETQSDFQKEMEDMDQFMVDMIQGSDAFGTLLILGSMEDAPINLDMTDPFALLGEAQGAFGTHTYVTTPDSSYWEYSDQPEDEVIIIVPISSENTSTIRLYDFSLSNTEASFKLSLANNDAVSLTATFSLMGTDLINPLAEPVLTSASINGTFTDNTGLTYDFSLSLSNTSAQLTFGALGVNALVITATGNNLTDASLSGEDSEAQIDEIVFKYRENIEIVISDPEADSGDVGDVYYKGEKIGDLVVEEGEEGRMLIVYNDGTEVDILTLLENIGGLLEFAGGIAL